MFSTFRRMTTLLLALVLCLALGSCSSKVDIPTDSPSWQEQYDLGIRYLSEGNYEEAIIAFTAAIEIDPKQADAYIGLADVYTAQGNPEKAAEILNQALDTVGDNEALSAALAELETASGEPGVPVLPGEVVRTERQELNNGAYQIWEYDANGLTVRLTRYNADGSVYFVHDYFYDGQGNKIAATITYSNPDANGSSLREFTFDLLGRTIKQIDYRANGEVWTEEYLYSDSAVTLSLHYVSPETGSASCSFLYNMASDEHEVQVDATGWSYETGIIDYVQIIEFDAQENEVSLNAFDENGNPTEMWEQ